MAFNKKREPVGEAGLFEYAVGSLARRMRKVRDLRRLTKTRARTREKLANAIWIAWWRGGA